MAIWRCGDGHLQSARSFPSPVCLSIAFPWSVHDFESAEQSGGAAVASYRVASRPPPERRAARPEARASEEQKPPRRPGNETMTGTAMRVGIYRSHRALLSCNIARQGPIASLCRSAAHAARRPAVVTIFPFDRQQQQLWFSTDTSKPTPDNKEDDDKSNTEEPPKILYEGPFAQLSLRLKRVSVTSAALGVVGVPLLMALHGGDVPATGQLAVGGTAIMAAAGSTVALSFCFSPYVHKLERVDDTSTQIKATTANILGMRVETSFDPSKDVGKAAGSRPFCNFTAKGVPMYVHPEMVYDDELRLQLIGAADLENLEKAKEAAEKNKDDDFL